MWFKHITPNWYYIDPVQNTGDSTWKPEDHDGSTVEKAAPSLPESLSDNTVYLIRRTDHTYHLNEGESIPKAWCYTSENGCSVSGAMRIAIIGMPKSTDEVYQYIPEAAQTAWGSDDYDWATLCHINKVLSKNHIDLNSRDVVIYNLMLRRFDLYDNNKYNETQDGTYSLINISCENVEVSKIYASVAENNYLDETERNGELFKNTNRYQRLTVRLMSINYSNTCHIWDSTLLAAHDGWDNGKYIYLYTRMGNCSIHDVAIHNIPIGGSSHSSLHGAYFEIGSPGNYQSLANIDFYNVKMYMYGTTISPSQSNRFRTLISGQASKWNVRDITVEMGENQFGTIFSNPQSYLISLSLFNPGSIVDGITANLPTCKGISLLNVDIPIATQSDWNYFHTPKSQWYIVKNISFLGTPKSDDGDSSVWGGNSTMININNGKATDGAYHYLYTLPQCQQLIVQNINVKSYYNTSDSGLVIRGALLDMVNNDLECRVRVQACTGKIGSITTYNVDSALIDDTASNLLYVGSITCNRNNPSNPYTGQQAISPSWRSQILVGSTNTKFIQDNNFSNDVTNKNDHMYICTSDTLEGNFVARNRPAKAETWSVYRTGGHSCTLRFLCEVSDISEYPLRIGDLPFAGIKRHLQAGINKCTFYMTMFGYNDYSQIKDKMRFRAKLPSGLYVGQNGEWSEDNDTVWNNIELNTSYKYTFYIEMEEAGDVEFSYQFWWYMLGGYTYLDPFPEITQI